MAQEARCTWTQDQTADEGMALLETEEIVLRGSARVVVKRKDIARFDVDGDNLTISHKHGMTRIALGNALAQEWATRLRAPEVRPDQLGLKTGSAVHVVGALDPALREQVDAVGVRFVPASAADIVLVAVSEDAALVQIGAVRAQLKDTAALWAFWSKGQKGTVDAARIREVALSARLIDVKEVRWSETVSAMKLVVPMAHRRAAPVKAPTKSGAPKPVAIGNKRVKSAGLTVDKMAPDLRAALDQDMEAKRVFLGLSPARQRGILVSLQDIKSREGRARLVERVVAGLHDGSIR